MGMHIDPVPSGGREFNANEIEEADVERQYRDARARQEAGSTAPKKPGFFKRLFSKKS